MANYDLDNLSSYGIKQVAIVAADEYEKFNNAYGKYFSEIYPCNESKNVFEKITIEFAREVIKQQVHLGNDIRLICLSEDNLLLTAQLRDEFNIPGLKLNAAIPFRNKLIMKDVLKSKDIRIPKYSRFDLQTTKPLFDYFQNLQQELGLPFILKPTSYLGGLGVVLIDSLSAFVEFFKENPVDVEYEAEEFISGRLFHCDSIRHNNKTIFSACCEYTNPNFDFQIGKSVISMPLKNNDPLTKNILSFNEIVLSALDYEQGISHHEFFMTEEGELVFLEIAARSPGAVVTPMYRHAFNVGMEDIDFKMTMDIPFELSITEKNYLSGIFPLMSGKIDRLINPQLNSTFEMKWVVKEGDTVKASKSLRDKSAAITAWHEDYQKLCEDFDLLKNFQNILMC